MRHIHSIVKITVFVLILMSGSTFGKKDAQAQTASCAQTGSATVTWTIPSGTNTSKQHVYYGTQNGVYDHAVRNLQPNARTLTIGSLVSCQKYFVQVQLIDYAGKSVWLPQQVLMNPVKSVLGKTVVNPKLRTQIPSPTAYNRGRVGGLPTPPVAYRTPQTRVLGTTNPSMMGCNMNGKASLSWTAPSNMNVTKFHIYYGTSANGVYQHAVRNLTSKASGLTINSLNTCQSYTARVQAIGTDGTTSWLPSQTLMVK